MQGIRAPYPRIWDISHTYLSGDLPLLVAVVVALADPTERTQAELDAGFLADFNLIRSFSAEKPTLRVLFGESQ